MSDNTGPDQPDRTIHFDVAAAAGRAEHPVWHERLAEPFGADEIALKPRLWCGKCRNAPGRVCGEHKQVQCGECHQKISEAHLHLSYVGHAEVTRRLLEVDPEWSWRPAYRDVDKDVLLAAIATGNALIVRTVIENSPPLRDASNGMWMVVTVHANDGLTVETLGYGDAEDKPPGPAATKEVIGDGIRNAMMRRGMALDLWSRSDRALEVTAQNAQKRPARGKAKAESASEATAPQQGRRKMPGNGEVTVAVQDLANKAHQIACQYLELRSAGKAKLPAQVIADRLKTEVYTPAAEHHWLRQQCYSKFTGNQMQLSMVIAEAKAAILGDGDNGPGGSGEPGQEVGQGEGAKPAE